MQVVGYEPRTETPAELLLASDGDVERRELAAGTTLDYGLGDRHCAGIVTEEGHEPCSDPEAPYCSLHRDRWPCARCTGDCDRPLPNCRREHDVYLAAFAPASFKVGVTRAGRLQTRLREQGADRGAHLRRVVDGRVARQIEADLATQIGDSVRVETKIDGLGRTVDEDRWRDVLADHAVRERYAFADDLDLDHRPVVERVARGTVRGVKGRVLVLEAGATTYAVDLRDLVGTELTTNPAPRDRQSSLGAY